eukprot:symbB.v1.2.013898.t1/scaffold969.1/size148062/8
MLPAAGRSLVALPHVRNPQAKAAGKGNSKGKSPGMKGKGGCMNAASWNAPMWDMSSPCGAGNWTSFGGEFSGYGAATWRHPYQGKKRRLVELDQIGRVQRQVLGMVTQAVVTDMPELYEGRSGRSCMRQLLDFYNFATDHTASRPDFWSFYAHLQDASGEYAGALESRFKQSRVLQARLWEEKDPDIFAEQLQDFIECLDLIDNTLDDPATKEMSKSQVDPFAYLLVDASKKLKEKLASTVQEPSWKPVVPKLESLAKKAQKR